MTRRLRVYSAVLALLASFGLGCRSSVGGGRPASDAGGAVEIGRDEVVVTFPRADIGLEFGLPLRDSAGFPSAVEWGVAIRGAETAVLRIEPASVVRPTSLSDALRHAQLVRCRNPAPDVVECDEPLTGEVAALDGGRVAVRIRDSAYVRRIHVGRGERAVLWIQRYWGRPLLWRDTVPLSWRLDSVQTPRGRAG